MVFAFWRQSRGNGLTVPDEGCLGNEDLLDCMDVCMCVRVHVCVGMCVFIELGYPEQR